MTLDNRKITKELTNKIKTTYIKIQQRACLPAPSVQETAKQTETVGKQVSVVWTVQFILQEQPFICGKNPAFQEKKVPVRFSSQDVDFGAASARIMILPLEAEDFR